MSSEESSASIPFMITAAMKQKLRERGFTDDQIRNLTAQEANDILRRQWTAAQWADYNETIRAGRDALDSAKSKVRKEEEKVIPINPAAVAKLAERAKKVTEGLEARRKADEELRKLGLDKEEDSEVEGDDGGQPGKARDPLWRARSALKYVVPTPANVLRVGRALHSTGEETAFRLWCDWMKPLGEDEQAARNRWGSFATDPPSTNKPITIATVYWHAKQAGWRWPIIFSSNKLDRIAASAEKALVKAGAEIYQRGSTLFRTVIEEVEATNNRKARIAQLKPISKSYMLGELSRYIDWHKVDEKKGLVPTGPNEVLSQLVLGRSGRWDFRRVSGVLMTPTLRPDGSLLVEPGYDERTKLILVEPPVMPPIPPSPAKEDAEAAIRLLDELIAECPFEDDASRSVALSAQMTPVVRAACGCAPVHATTAPAAGTGKSYISEIAAAIALGQPCPIVPVGVESIEFEKRFNAHLMAGTTMLTLDNMLVGLTGDFLCQAVTSEVYIPRILGKSEIVRLVNGWTLFANGNNLRVERDMTRRTLLCKMDAKMERPELRSFKGEPHLTVLANRGKYIASVLTIVRAYVAAGKPDCAPRIANFGAWSDLVRSPLIWLGYADPAESMEAAREADPHLQNRRHIFQALADAFGVGEENARSTNEIAAIANGGVMYPAGMKPTTLEEHLSGNPSKNAELLKEALMPVAAQGSLVHSNKIGYWFRANKGEIARNLVLRAKQDRTEVVNLWWVDRCS